MALGAVAEGQDVIGPKSGLIPRGRHRHVAAHKVLSGERLDPGEAVGVGPHGVVDAGEVGVESAAAIQQEVRQQDRQFVGRHRELRRPEQFIP